VHLHLDAIGGVAGDMFIAAVLDAFPHLRDGMLQAIHAGGLPEDITCRTVEHRDDVLTGLRFVVEGPAYRPRDRGLALPEERHRHTPFREIRSQLERSSLAPGVKHRAIHIFTLLADVEGKVHGMPAEAVSFHELGGWDSIADMVGAAFLLDALDAPTWSVGALPQGSGRVKTDHGWLPIPTPATALLLQGFQLIDDGLHGERVTPTGAAILKHLNAAQKDTALHNRQPRRLLHMGCGFGTRTLPGLSNVLRVLALEETTERTGSDRIAQIAFEVDDQSPEDLAIALDRLRAHPSVLDVLQIPAFGKKGRMTAHIQILAEPEDVDGVFEACFRETATLGLRWHVQERRILPRSQATVDVDGRSVRVKVAERPGALTAKAESDDLLSVMGGRRERENVRQAAESAGLSKENK
jgi:pyridinium-3,5-bisthiocarboxylic acid mononucleotide nickel chelatase